MDEEAFAGGIGNGGLVVRAGDTVRRPWHPSTPATHELLTYLDRVLPGVAPVPLGRDEQGREVLSYLDGDVAVPPFPVWVTSTEFLVSLGELLRQIHDALSLWQPPPGLVWSDQIPDPEGGALIVHTDVCPENVIVREGRAVAIIDWEFASPGRAIWDVVSTARLCVPFVSPDRRDPVHRDLDVSDRLRTFIDAYGLSAAGRADFVRVLDQRRQAGEQFTRKRVALGEPAFVKQWAGPAGEEKYATERDWVRAVSPGVIR